MSNQQKTNPSIIVTRRPLGKPHQGLLRFFGRTFPCILGRSGITTNKHEGDGATPAGSYDILYGFYRKDRISRPVTRLEMFEINNKMGWCDQSGHPAYNRMVELPFSSSHEEMLRKDQLYDLCLVLDYNFQKRIQNRGSAIFFHLASPDYRPTEGCVALDPADMLHLLSRLRPNTTMTILP